MAQWYLDTDNQLLIDTFQRFPFDVMTFEETGNAVLHSRMECIGVGNGLKALGELLAYIDVPNLTTPVFVTREDECVILVTREKAAARFIAEWFRVEPCFCPYQAFDRTSAIASSEEQTVPYPTSTMGMIFNTASNQMCFNTAENRSVSDIFKTIRDTCTKSVMCFLDGSRSLSEPILLDVCASDESDAVALGMLEPVSNYRLGVSISTVYNTGSTYASSFTLSADKFATSSISANIRDASFTVAGKTVDIREEHNGEISIKIGDQHFVEREERSSDCLYPCIGY